MTITTRGRPAMRAEERKVRTTLRLPPDVIEYFRGTGPGWQSRISETLSRHVERARRRLFEASDANAGKLTEFDPAVRSSNMSKRNAPKRRSPGKRPERHQQ
jgi:BrnA antitoxin of type II toxin-antitoxin system